MRSPVSNPPGGRLWTRNSCFNINKMAKLRILQEPHKILRAKAKEISAAKIKSPAVQKLIRDMAQTLKAVEVGIGLAAQQVGKSMRLFLVSKEALAPRPVGKKLDLTK